MEVMGVIAVMVNLALLGMGGSVQRMFPNMTVTDRIILIIVLEVSFTYFLDSIEDQFSSNDNKE